MDKRIMTLSLVVVCLSIVLVIPTATITLSYLQAINTTSEAEVLLGFAKLIAVALGGIAVYALIVAAVIAMIMAQWSRSVDANEMEQLITEVDKFHIPFWKRIFRLLRGG